MAAIRRRILCHALVGTSAAAFLIAHSSVVTHTPSDVWSVMLRRHLGVPVFDDTALLKCARCDTPMDHLGDHAADLCAKGYGWKNRHKAICDLLAKDLFQAAGARALLEAKHLLPGLQGRLADTLVHPLPCFANPMPTPSVAYDITISSLYEHSFTHLTAHRPQAVANAADRRNTRAFATKVPATAGEGTSRPPDIAWNFAPLAFDSLSTPSSSTKDVIRKYVSAIAIRSGTSFLLRSISSVVQSLARA